MSEQFLGALELPFCSHRTAAFVRGKVACRGDRLPGERPRMTIGQPHLAYPGATVLSCKVDDGVVGAPWA